ncbi:ABC transporter ATP-binding protein [Actinomyces sp. MRS3W]|uniref:ABC transporter ATP-binding protein n=1 Tax=Actinomyces sp. MRS3W TaxID=2800796 RepID=UPI0028FD67A6|nr:ABC transporter ATP-binding protein [Actinomyces sp. MRS3W]MDU0348486.1 ABC transporter ATP-binding protein [Actinomyces sp. MRS3W]
MSTHATTPNAAWAPPRTTAADPALSDPTRPTASAPSHLLVSAPAQPARNGSDWVVTTDGLTKSYGDFRAVDDVNLRVPHGGVYGFLGPNGAGKSTTMKLLLGLTRPTAGTMSVLGRPVSARSPLAAGTIGSLIEGPSYYPRLTGAENLAMLADYLGLPHSRVGHALTTVALADQGKKLVRDYSLGMKQRLGLAMALLADPPLILLDEPTNGLDPAGVAEIRELIVSLARQEGTTIIVSSHILSEIEQMADVVGIICAGRLRYQGPLSGLQDAGVIDFTVSDPDGLAGLLAERRITHRVQGRTVRTPMLPDAAVGDLVTGIVHSGGTIFRVQTVRKTLEQAFLELTDPASSHPAGTPTASDAPAAAIPSLVSAPGAPDAEAPFSPTLSTRQEARS